MKVTYKALFIYNRDGICVVFPECPGCITFGNSDAQAKDMAQDALKTWCKANLDDGLNLPKMSMVEFSVAMKEYQSKYKKVKIAIKNVTVEVDA